MTCTDINPPSPHRPGCRCAACYLNRFGRPYGKAALFTDTLLLMQNPPSGQDRPGEARYIPRPMPLVPLRMQLDYPQKGRVYRTYVYRLHAPGSHEHNMHIHISGYDSPRDPLYNGGL